MFKNVQVRDRDELGNCDTDQTKCCGILELDGLDNHPLAIIQDILDNTSRSYTMVIFHDVVSYRNGVRLARFIKRHKLGDVNASRKVRSATTGNYIQMWTWYPDWGEVNRLMVQVKFIWL